MAIKTAPAPNGNGKAPKDPSAPVSVESNRLGLGRTGLKQWSGRIDEEFLKELKYERKYQVYKEMSENDPIVGAVLRAIEFLIRGVEWRIQPQDQTDTAQVELGEQIDQRFQTMQRSWSEVLVEILSFLPYGWSFHELLYESRPDGVYWADWPIRAQETLWKWEFQKDQDGKDTDTLTGMTQQIPTGGPPRTIPISKGLLFRLETYKSNPEGRSVLRNAYLPWYYKNHLQRIEAIGIERDLAGYPCLYVPGEVLDTPSSAAYLAAQKIVTNVKRDEQEGVLLSSAVDGNGNRLWELKLLSTGGQRSFDTNTIINRYDQRIAMTCLADFVLLGHEKVGSFALASSKTDVFALALKAILDTICGVVNRHAIPQLAELNGWPTEDLPELVHSDIEIPDLQEIGAYITALSGAGIPLFPNMKLENRLMEMANLPVLSPKEWEDREAQAEADKQMQMELQLKAAKAGANQDPNALPDQQMQLAAAGKPEPGEEKPEGGAEGKPKPAEKGAGAVKKDEAGGSWVTINGTPVYIEDGQSVDEAIDEEFGSDRSDDDRSSKPAAGKSVRLKGGVKGTVVRASQVPAAVRNKVPARRFRANHFWVRASAGNYVVAHTRDIEGPAEKRSITAPLGAHPPRTL